MPIVLPVAIDFTLELAVLAVVGLLLIIAASSLAGLTQRWFGSAPWPLSIIGPGAAAAFVSAVYDGIRWAGASADGLAQVITAPFQAIWSWAWYTTETVSQAASAVWKMRYQVIPAVETSLINWTLALVGMEAQARAAADQVVAQYARALTGAAEAYALGLAQEVAQFVQQVVGAEGQARAAGDQLVAEYAQAAAGEAERYAQALDTATLGYVNQVAGDLVRYTAAGVLGAEDYARGIGVAVEDYARSLEGIAVQHADAAVGAAAAAAAAATAAVAARVTAIEDSPCQQYCSLLGGLGQLLQGLEDVGLEALLVALLAEAQQHPDQVMAAIDGTIGAAARDAGRSLQLGIPA